MRILLVEIVVYSQEDVLRMFTELYVMIIVLIPFQIAQELRQLLQEQNVIPIPVQVTWHQTIMVPIVTQCTI